MVEHLRAGGSDGEVETHPHQRLAELPSWRARRVVEDAQEPAMRRAAGEGNQHDAGQQAHDDGASGSFAPIARDAHVIV